MTPIYLKVSGRIINIDAISVIHAAVPAEIVVRFIDRDSLTLKGQDAADLVYACRAIATDRAQSIAAKEQQP